MFFKASLRYLLHTLLSSSWDALSTLVPFEQTLYLHIALLGISEYTGPLFSSHSLFQPRVSHIRRVRHTFLYSPYSVPWLDTAFAENSRLSRLKKISDHNPAYEIPPFTARVLHLNSYIHVFRWDTSQLIESTETARNCISVRPPKLPFLRRSICAFDKSGTAL